MKTKFDARAFQEACDVALDALNENERWEIAIERAIETFLYFTPGDITLHPDTVSYANNTGEADRGAFGMRWVHGRGYEP